MKASELIEKLQKIVAENGDVDVTIYNHEFEDSDDIETVFKVEKSHRQLIKGTSWPNDKYENIKYSVIELK